MSATAWPFAAVMVAALYEDVAIARDSWKRGWIGLALFGSLAAVCAVIGLVFVINGGAS